MTGKLKFELHDGPAKNWRAYKCAYNGYHLSIEPTSTTTNMATYTRGVTGGDPLPDNWLDTPHKRVTDALEELHNALSALVAYDQALLEVEKHNG